MSKVIADINSEKYTKDRLGLIAQELQQVFPEVVKTDNEGYLRVNYDQLIPVLVEAIKEQQQQINQLKSELESNLKSTNLSNLSNTTSDSKLYQNNPNPFNQETEIWYNVISDIRNASLYIYDMHGTQIKSYDIQERGHSSHTIHGSELNPGMYLYTLIVDGQEVDTKRMILTD